MNENDRKQRHAFSTNRSDLKEQKVQLRLETVLGKRRPLMVIVCCGFAMNLYFWTKLACRAGWSEGSAGWWTLPAAPAAKLQLETQEIDCRHHRNPGPGEHGERELIRRRHYGACHGTQKLLPPWTFPLMHRTCIWLVISLVTHSDFCGMNPLALGSSHPPRPRWVCSWFLSGCAGPPDRTPAPHRRHGSNTVAHKTPDPPHSIAPGRWHSTPARKIRRQWGPTWGEAGFVARARPTRNGNVSHKQRLCPRAIESIDLSQGAAKYPHWLRWCQYPISSVHCASVPATHTGHRWHHLPWRTKGWAYAYAMRTRSEQQQQQPNKK